MDQESVGDSILNVHVGQTFKEPIWSFKLKSLFILLQYVQYTYSAYIVQYVVQWLLSIHLEATVLVLIGFDTVYIQYIPRYSTVHTEVQYIAIYSYVDQNLNRTESKCMERSLVKWSELDQSLVRTMQAGFLEESWKS